VTAGRKRNLVGKLGVMLSVAGLFLAGCAGESESPGGSAQEADCIDLTGSATAEIVMLDNKFDPDCLTVSGDQGLAIRNEGNVVHDFSVEGSDIRLDVPPGEETNTEAIGGMLQPGEAKVLCTYHPEMTAEMTVT
jgi:plastocyanin